MKRRVVFGKETKHHLRLLRTACRTSAPYPVIIDASAARVVHQSMRGVAISTLIADSFDGADGLVSYVPATKRVLEASHPAALPLLDHAKPTTAGRTTADQNEVKALVAALKEAAGPNRVQFLLSQNHDVRNAAASLPFVVLLHVAKQEKRLFIDAPSVQRAAAAASSSGSSVSLGGAASSSQSKNGPRADHHRCPVGKRIRVPDEGPPLGAKDAAFLRMLAAERQIPSVPATAARRAPTAAAQPETAGPTAAETVRRRSAREAKRNSRPNPLSTKKKKTKLVYHAPSE